MPGHDHHHHDHAVASAPTLSLLRLSAGQRLVGVAVILAVIWSLTLAAVA